MKRADRSRTHGSAIHRRVVFWWMTAAVALAACIEAPPAPQLPESTTESVVPLFARALDGETEVSRRLDELSGLIQQLQKSGDLPDGSASTLSEWVRALVEQITNGDRKEFARRLVMFREMLGRTPMSELARKTLITATDSIQNFLERFVVPVIIEPRRGSASTRCPPFQFIAAAYDFFGQRLSDVIFDWSSDISGAFAVGDTTWAILPPGRHTITLEAVRLVGGWGVHVRTATSLDVERGQPIAFAFSNDMPTGEVGSGLQGSLNVTLPFTDLPATVKVRSSDQRLLDVSQGALTEGNREITYRQRTIAHAYVLQARENDVGEVSVAVEAESARGTLACGLQLVDVVRPALDFTLTPPPGQQDIVIWGNTPRLTGLRVGLPSSTLDPACNCPDSVIFEQRTRFRNSGGLPVTITATPPAEVTDDYPWNPYEPDITVVFPPFWSEFSDAAWVTMRSRGSATVTASSPGFTSTKRAQLTLTKR